MGKEESDTARAVAPFVFLQGKPDQDVQTFEEFLEKKRTPGVHPSLQGDVPDADGEF